MHDEPLKGPKRKCEPKGSLITEIPDYDQTCPVLPNSDHGEWNCDKGETVGSICRLNCDEGFAVTGRGNTRRCRCSDKRQACYWTRHNLQCLRQSNLEIWSTPDEIPVNTVAKGCPLLYENDSGEKDDFKHGNWVCETKNQKIKKATHQNKLGTRSDSYSLYIDYVT